MQIQNYVHKHVYSLQTISHQMLYDMYSICTHYKNKHAPH